MRAILQNCFLGKGKIANVYEITRITFSSCYEKWIIIITSPREKKSLKIFILNYYLPQLITHYIHIFTFFSRKLNILKW